MTDKKAGRGNPGITEEKEASGIVVAANFDDIEVAKPDEQVGVADILAALASPEADGAPEDASEWSPSIVGSDYFWPAGKGMVIRGVVLGVEDRMTSLVLEGEQVTARFYTIELTAECIAIRSSDMLPGMTELPKPVVCQPGMHVSVLERTILRRLERSIGKEVIVVCDGPSKTKRGLNLWKYRSWERRPPLEVIDQRSVGSAQPRSLPSAG